MKPKNRRPPRVYVTGNLDGDTTELPPDRAHYLRSVLRRKPGDQIIVFDGIGTERRARIESVSRERASVSLGDSLAPLAESRLRLVLLQSLVKADAMDLIVRKCSELGVCAIVPVATEFSVVRLDESRARRRTAHWRRIAASACEQCGRHRPPSIETPRPLGVALGELDGDQPRIALQAGADRTLGNAMPESTSYGSIALLVGPEGGLSDADLREAARAKFVMAALGPRMLRVDTAAIAACAIVQSRWGDLAD